MTSTPLDVRVLIALLALVLGMIVLTQWRATAREAEAERDYPPLGQILDVDGVKVHVLIKGQEAGTAPDLVLIHGASGNLRDMTFDLADRLTDSYRVIMVDRPGLGWTDRLPGNAGAWNGTSETPQEQAALLHDAVLQVGATNPIVLGHSYGGSVAVAWGLAYPDMTAALVLVSAASEPWPGSLGLLYQVTGSAWGGALVIPLATAFVPESIVTSSIESIFAPQEAPEGYAAYIGTDLALRRKSMRGNAQQVNSLLPHMLQMKQEYDHLTMPIELVHGTTDNIVPAHIHAEVFVRDVPTARLKLLPGVGHMPHHIQPQEVVDAIDRASTRAGLR